MTDRVVSFAEASDRMAARGGPTSRGRALIDQAKAKLDDAGAKPSSRPGVGPDDHPTKPPAGIDEKAKSILADGRLEVHTVHRDHVHALVHGNNGTYSVTYGPRDGWACGCPAGQHGRRCSHLVAVELVTTARRSA